jgi:hypothetical protein
MLNCSPGIAWSVSQAPWLTLARTRLGRCRYFQHATKNLCDELGFTGYAVDGGHAEYTAAASVHCFAIAAGRQRRGDGLAHRPQVAGGPKSGLALSFHHRWPACQQGDPAGAVWGQAPVMPSVGCLA